MIKFTITSSLMPVQHACFDQDTISIGRAKPNDLCLSDTTRLVSSRHASIKKMEQGYALTDMKSTNGTMLNGQRLIPGREHPLKVGDRIRIGHFTIDVSALSSYALGEDSSADKVDAVDSPCEEATAPPRTEEPLEQIVYDLHRVYADPMSEHSAKNKIDQLTKVLKQGIQHLNSLEAIELLEGIEALFITSLPMSSVPKAKTIRSKAVDAQAAYDGLMELAGKYCSDWDLAASSEVVNRLLDRIDVTLNVTIQSLHDAIKARREFTREFEINATRLLAWTPNPIKSAESNKEIFEYLLDPRKPDIPKETVAADLKGALEDLALHQLGLLAGFKECLRGLLAELAPKNFESNQQAGSYEIGPLKISKNRTSSEKEAWTKFKRKYAQLSEEEVRVFENILAPHFAKGYMSIQKVKSRH